MAIEVFPYNISPKIRVAIDNIKSLREKILLQPLSHHDERQLRWNSKISKIHWSLAIAGGNLTRPEIAKILVRKDRVVLGKIKPEDNTLGVYEQEVINYNNALEYIDYNWFVSNEKVEPKTILLLYKLSSEPKLRSTPSKFRSVWEDVSYLLDYLQSGSEEAIIQAGIAQIQLRLISPFDNYNGKITRLLSNLILYKHGLDFRGILVMDEYFRRDIVDYRNSVNSVRELRNLTHWLEYYTEGMRVQLTKSLDLIRSPIASLGVPAGFWQLNERQKAILTVLENPEETITNRGVQERFKVSQITASRDLTKLTKMGSLLTRGKGRSVFYMRVV